MNKNNKKAKAISMNKTQVADYKILDKSVFLAHDGELHEDYVEYSYSLSLEAVKRLLKSYYDEIRAIHERNTNTRQTDQREFVEEPYYYAMIGDIKVQLNKLGLNGKKVADEVFQQDIPF